MTIRKAGLGLEERILDNALEPDNPEEPILDERLVRSSTTLCCTRFAPTTEREREVDADQRAPLCSAHDHPWSGMCRRRRPIRIDEAIMQFEKAQPRFGFRIVAVEQRAPGRLERALAH